jgi:hypothetical protein
MLRKYNCKLKDNKDQFRCIETEFVEYEVSLFGIYILDRKITSITNWPRVHLSKDTCIFIELVRAYRKFVLNFGMLAMPLNTLTTFLKSEFAEHMIIPSNYIAVFNTIIKIKELMTIDRYLAHPHTDIDTLFVRTEISDFSIGAMLCQIQPIINTTTNCPQPLRFEK